MQTETFDTVLGGKEFSASFTDLAEQTNGSLLVKSGDTVVLVTAVLGKKDRTDIDFLPLSVEFEEKFYAAGQILGSRFLRREGKPSDEAVLSGRVIDRTIRPLFPMLFRRDVQVVVTVLSIGEDDPDVLGVNAASLVLASSDIPWGGPVSAVRVGKKKNEATFVINPSYEFRTSPDLELDVLVCGMNNTVTMVEVGASEVSEATLVEALACGLEQIKEIQQFQERVIAARGKEKVPFSPPATPPFVADLFSTYSVRFEEAVFSGVPGTTALSALKSEFLGQVAERTPEAVRDADRFFESAVAVSMRRGAIERKARADGRAPDEVRPLFAQAGGISSMLHGSGIFYRGGTHIFSALTLGGPEDSQIIDSIEGVESKKRFMHHYNFPPFSVGEVGKFGGMNRRMVGHGALAEKALLPVIPSQEVFPYTIRLVSEALASNGSTSMASVCAGTLALMDGGVPITRPVAGIAVGVMYENPKRYCLLTDIQGPEDHHGDMDFKVAGTDVGVTAIQLDVKVEGVPLPILAEALEKARRARLDILAVMKQAIPAPRPHVSPRAPAIVTLRIPVELIGYVIGGQGKNIKKIQEETGVESIVIEDDGRVFVTGTGDAPDRAASIIRDMTRVFTPGETLDVVVTRVVEFGAFARLNSRTEGLIHISEFAPFRVARADEVVSVGETVRASVKSVDHEGRVTLSIKAVDPEFASRKGVMPAPDTDTAITHGRRTRSRTKETPRE